MKVVWYFFGGVLLIMAITSFWVAMSINCPLYSYSCGYSYGYDYRGSYDLNYDCGYDYNDDYYQCKRFRNGQAMKSMIYFWISIVLFALGGESGKSK